MKLVFVRSFPRHNQKRTRRVLSVIYDVPALFEVIFYKRSNSFISLHLRAIKIILIPNRDKIAIGRTFVDSFSLDLLFYRIFPRNLVRRFVFRLLNVYDGRTVSYSWREILFIFRLFFFVLIKSIK